MSHANSILTTDRLTLEPLTAAHAPALFAGFSDPALYPFIPQNPPASLEALTTRYQRLETRSSPDGSEWWLNWVVRLGSDGDYIGLVEATVDEDNEGTMAWFIFTPYQRQGYAAEAVARVREHIVDAFMAETVVAYIDTRNAASIALVEKLCFKREKLLPDADHFKGSKSDEYRYRYTPPGSAPAKPKKAARR